MQMEVEFRKTTAKTGIQFGNAFAETFKLKLDIRFQYLKKEVILLV